ncbi:MAG: MFS transporter [Ruminococcaceae bacterium]|nr:MFS transporter [Oscillospiraceae bacterium]
METALKSRKSNLFFTIMCCLVYFTSYVTRINFGAAVLEISNSLQTPDTVIGTALTASFITYGFGQLISGVMGDKISPRLLIFIGVCVTSGCNLLVSMMQDVLPIIIIWGINGFAQAFLWPPLVRIMAERLEGEHYQKCCAYVNMAASLATILMYLIVPGCIVMWNWRAVFILSGSFGFIMAIVWLLTSKGFTSNNALKVTKAVNKEHPVPEEHRSVWEIMGTTWLPLVMLVIALQGLLRDGITTWMPTYISDIFKLDSASAIFTSVILPIFTIISLYVTRLMCKKFKSEVSFASWIWVGAVVCGGLLMVFYKTNLIVSVIVMSLITSCMHGVNLLLIGNLPVKFLKFGKISTVSGLLNSCTYIGSAFSTYVIAGVSEAFGWDVTIISWIIISAAAFVLLRIVFMGKKKFYE